MNDYPLFLYEYDAQGRYGKPLEIGNSAALTIAMETIVKTAISEHREIIITDGGDDCVFHAKDGGILFPTPEDISRGS